MVSIIPVYSLQSWPFMLEDRLWPTYQWAASWLGRSRIHDSHDALEAMYLLYFVVIVQPVTEGLAIHPLTYEHPGNHLAAIRWAQIFGGCL